MKNVGLFFGSFNPIHNGHLIVAEFICHERNLDKIIFVVSPQNPFKKNQNLWDENLRFTLVQKAIEDNPYFEASDIEFSMPKPSFTYRTLCKLRDENQDTNFSLIMGSDNLPRINEWKDYEKILSEFKLDIYNRPGFESNFEHENVLLHNAPLIDISATLIRELISKGKSVKYLLPEAVIEILQKEKILPDN